METVASAEVSSESTETLQVSCCHDCAELKGWNRDCCTESYSQNRSVPVLSIIPFTLIRRAPHGQRDLGIVDSSYKLMNGLIRIHRAIELTESLHFVAHYVIIDPLLRWVFALQLVQLLKPLILTDKMQCLGPFMQTQTDVAKLCVDTALEVNVLTVEFPTLRITY